MAEDRVERRLTTILAADVVGYSRLMAADEAGTLTSLKALRRELIEPKTAEYHGRVVKLIGDGTLMEFASVVDAVTFAVEFQRAMAERNAGVPEDCRIAYRVGVNIGDVIVEGDDKYPEKFRVGLELYNLHRALASERYEEDGLVIVFDFFDVIALFEAGITNAVALMVPQASDPQLGKLRELDNPSGRFTVAVAHLDQAAGEALACKLVNVGYAHLAVAPLHEALSAMAIEELERLLP